ncbi:MAG TPA: cupin domain-containing protein [Mycobacteriales bacterium]|nr:cupin domain-containing protein [Mycobacteriales bacterium]
MTAVDVPSRYQHPNDNVPGDGSKMFFYDSDTLPYEKNETYAQMLPEEERETFLDAVGRDMVSALILQSPTLSMVRVRVGPGARVQPHRHGTNQITYVLSGSLQYGKRVTHAGQGFFSPNKKYSWVAGDEGAEWIEIHAGEPLPYKLD